MTTRHPIAHVRHFLVYGAGQYCVHVEYTYAGYAHTPPPDEAWRFSLN